MLNRIKFFLPTRIFFGEGCLSEFLPEASALGKNALIVTGKFSARKTGLLDTVCRVLKQSGVTCHVCDTVSPEPAVKDCVRVAEESLKYDVDMLVAVGGGSAMDVAKAASVLMKNPGPCQNYFGEEKFVNEPLPVVAIPTTCGSGSEVTRYAVIIDEQTNTKKTISSERIIPKIAILDPITIKSLPGSLIAGTGMDALCHAVEGFLSIKANNLTQLFSRAAIKLIIENIEDAAKNFHMRHIEPVFLGSLYAGFVINHTGTIFIHGMAYGLTIRHRVHHGTANALCLPYALLFLKQHGYEEEIKKLEEFITPQAIIDMNKKMGLPSRLRDLGLQQSEIDILAEMAIVGCERSFKNMKQSFSKDDFVQIFTSMF
ncbi:MAG TPA: iron-containing alcohol dehydrogenase [bacterium]|nr:iron-containing alcohol dehydrogenase [bacterium]HPP07505.1 iron-containing alcohol dehydrogenase [bacterium]